MKIYAYHVVLITAISVFNEKVLLYVKETILVCDRQQFLNTEVHFDSLIVDDFFCGFTQITQREVNGQLGLAFEQFR